MVDARRFLKDYARAVLDDTAGVFIGAGTSRAAGYPSWKKLLKEVADELSLELHDLDDLAAVAQWAMRQHGSTRTRVSQAIYDQINPDREIPAALKVIARLPIRSMWTTNYDRLIERSLIDIARPYDLKASQAQLSVKSAEPGAVKIYKMHGTIDDVDSLVIATNDYELYGKDHGAFLNLLEAQLTSSTFLFTGVSLTDPNLRHVLAAIRLRFSKDPPQHFLLMKTPERQEFATDAEFETRSIRHRYWTDDLQRYGFQVLEVETYGEIDRLLIDLERRVAQPRIWVSGSWPEQSAECPSDQVRELAEQLGKMLAAQGLTLVTGSGLLVGPASLRGFLTGLQEAGRWDLERRLIVRPFPQPLAGQQPNLEQWQRLRDEMARVSGIVIFVGGLKSTSEGIVEAGGVWDEFARARASNCFLVPIGASGGAAAGIAKELIGSAIPFDGSTAQRPSDEELQELARTDVDNSVLVETVRNIIQRFERG